MFTLAWERNKILGQILGDFQGRAFAVLFYFTIMLPFGLGARLFGDLLNLKSQPQWIDREPVGTTLEEAQRQG